MTLTGLLFVVVSLGPRLIANHQATGVRAFISPNAVYFTTTLVVSALLMVPDLPAVAIGTCLCFGALASLGYLAYTKAHQQWRHGKLPLLDWDLVCQPANSKLCTASAFRHRILVALRSVDTRCSRGADSSARDRNQERMGPRYLYISEGA